MPRHLIVFDIDGTLLDSSAVDGRLFVEAVTEVFGPLSFRRNWTDYTHVSDQGLLLDMLRDNGLSLDSRRIQQVQHVLLKYLNGYLQEHGPFQEIPGAREFVQRLQKRVQTAIAYATGGWKQPAELKLKTAGFPLEGIPLATSDDHYDRTEIMRTALRASPVPVNRITYFGDGLWDEQACEKLDWHFVAVGAQLGGLESFAPVDVLLDQIRLN